MAHRVESWPAKMRFRNITTATTTVVKSENGSLSRIVVNKAAANAAIAVFDNTSGSGTLIATITMPAVLLTNHFQLDYNVGFSNGLTIVTSGASDITVVYL